MSTNAQIENAIALATRMKPLVEKDRGKLESRLEAGIIDGMLADTDHVRDESTGTVVVRQSKKAATTSLAEIAAETVILVQAVRNGCKQKRLAKSILDEVGVGKPIQPKVVKSVADAASLVIKAYEAHVDELRRAGVLPADIERITVLRDRLTSSDKDQEQRKTTSKEKTASRNDAYKRLVTAMAAIIGAAELAFATDPVRLELYRALRPTGGHHKKSPAVPVA